MNSYRINSNFVFPLIGKCPDGDCPAETKEVANLAFSSAMTIISEITSCYWEREDYTIILEILSGITIRKWLVLLNKRSLSTTLSVHRSVGSNIVKILVTSTQCGGPGDFLLEVTMFYGKDSSNYFSRIIKPRTLNSTVLMNVKNFGLTKKSIPFELNIPNGTFPGDIYIKFGDGTVANYPDYASSRLIEWKTYNHSGSYFLEWKFCNKYEISQGRKLFEALPYQPVNQSERYLFPTSIEISWPNRSVSFFITSDCLFLPPTDAMYRIDYGDGSNYTSWTRVPHYECGKSARLPTHTYDNSGCYNVKFQIKNLLGLRNDTSNVSIDQVSNKILLRFNTVPPLLESNKKVADDGNVYLSDEFPFQIEAIFNASTCYRFEWTIQNPYWHISTSNISKVKINHLVNKAGDYNLTVNVSGKTRTMSKTKQFIVLKALRNLAILSTTPSDDKQVYVYLLLKEPGPSPMLTWDFGDEKIIKERGINFITANNLPKIRNALGSRKLDLATYKGLYKKHKFRNNGLFHVSVKANDLFRELTARRTVFVSNSPCRRPKVNILIPNGSSKFTISIGETFTVQTHVEMRCDFSDQAIFRWEVYSSNKKDMESARIAESDRKIK